MQQGAPTWAYMSLNCAKHRLIRDPWLSDSSNNGLFKYSWTDTDVVLEQCSIDPEAKGIDSFWKVLQNWYVKSFQMISFAYVKDELIK